MARFIVRTPAHETPRKRARVYVQVLPDEVREVFIKHAATRFEDRAEAERIAAATGGKVEEVSR